MLNKIKEETLFIKILGSYPSAKTKLEAFWFS